MKNKALVFLVFALSCLSVYSRPVRPGIYTFHQPDGSSFQGRCYGDEFIRIKTTLDGHAIVQDADGWWQYAAFDSNGFRRCSGFRIGSDTPGEVLDNSRNIPYGQIIEHARLQRSAGERRRSQEPFMLTKSGDITRHGLVILAEFKDVSFQYSREEFVDMLSKDGYSRYGATGSAKEYFDGQFNGMADFSFEVSEKVTLSGRRAYYGANDESGDDSRPAEMIKEACMLAYEQGVDFSLYDYDNDGYVDNVFVFFAGEDEAENPDQEELIWSHAWYIEGGAGMQLQLNGKKIDRYACTAELSSGYLAGIGTFCHEYSHTFGLPDFYDTDYEDNGWAMGLWNSTSVMDGGNSNNGYNTPPFFNVIEREIMGLAEPQTLTHNGTYTLKPIHANGQTYKIPSDSPDEYYLLECRGNKDWDGYIGGYGLLVYHIDKSDKKAWEISNTVNVDPQQQLADLIEADGRIDATTSMNGYVGMLSNISGIFFPYAGTTAFTPDSTPGIRFRNGSKATISITGIKRDGENVIFTVTGLKGEEPPIPVNVKTESFMDAAIINFESDRTFEGSAIVEWGRTGQPAQNATVLPYETGKYAIVLEGLTPGNKTYTANICFEIDGTMGESRKVSFMTSREGPVRWPYIHFGKAANEDGTFSIGAKLPMRVYNASGAEAIEWEFNGKKSGPQGNGYLTVSEAGTLRAIVYWPDGSTDILEKEIILSE